MQWALALPNFEPCFIFFFESRGKFPIDTVIALLKHTALNSAIKKKVEEDLLRG